MEKKISVFTYLCKTLYQSLSSYLSKIYSALHIYLNKLFHTKEFAPICQGSKSSVGLKALKRRGQRPKGLERSKPLESKDFN
jgi:hypothetical protein